MSPTPSAPSSAPTTRPWELVRALIAEQRRDFLLGGVFLAVSGVCAGAIPQCIRLASDALHAGDASRAAWAAGGIALFAALGAAVRVASRTRIFNAGREVEFVLRERILARLHTLGPSFYRRVSSGEIMSRSTNDLAQVRLLVGFGALNLLNTAFAYAVNIPLLFARSPMLAALALLPYPVFVLLTQRFGRQMFTRSKEAQEALGDLSDKAQRALGAMRVVRAYNLEAATLAEFDGAAQRALEANLSLARLRGMMFPILGAGAASSSLIVVWVGARLVMQHEGFTVGDILAFQVHLGLIAWPTIALGYLLSIVQRGRASVERIAEVLDATPDIDDRDAEPAAPEALAGGIAVRGLSYAIDGRPLLDDVSLEVPAGRSLAVVGRTGAGKSLLVQLLARMLPTPAGTVFVDDRDITRLPLKTLRAVLGVAQQEPFLFSSTVTRNVAFGAANPDDPATLAAVRGALSEAQLLAEAEAMPDGLYTIVGERGVQLSGGQKQRVALARALLAAPKVLVLDDPLSAVDARTEAGILDAIDRAAAGRTLVLVTHRVSAARRCDSVVVLDGGRVVERGTHESLVACGGLYARMAERQRLEAELEDL